MAKVGCILVGAMEVVGPPEAGDLRVHQEGAGWEALAAAEDKPWCAYHA